MNRVFRAMLGRTPIEVRRDAAFLVGLRARASPPDEL
jgi:hypothetical protein